MIAYWAEGSIRFISGRLRASPGSTATRAAKVTGRSYVAAQSLSSVCTPDFPARAAAHVLGTSPPSGVVAPMPVTTTSGSLVTVPPGQVVGGSSSPRAGGWAVRGVRGASDGLVGRRTSPARSVLRARDEGHGVADGGEVLDLVVGDADRELLLGEGDDRHHRQGVDVEVVGEGLLRRDGVSGQPGLLADDLGQAGQDLLLAVRHRCLLVRWCRCLPAPAPPHKEPPIAYSEQEILAGLAEIVSEETGLPTDSVSPEKSFTDDLDIDSLSMMTIVTLAEEKFLVRIPDDEVKNLTTVGDAVSFIAGAQD